MISREAAKRVMAGFSAYPGYPKTVEGKRALLDAFQASGRDDDHMRLVGQWLHETGSFCPTPADVWKGAKGVLESREPLGPKDTSCQRCVNGWIEAPGGVKRCGCKTKTYPAAGKSGGQPGPLRITTHNPDTSIEDAV